VLEVGQLRASLLLAFPDQWAALRARFHADSAVATAAKPQVPISDETWTRVCTWTVVSSADCCRHHSASIGSVQSVDFKGSLQVL